MTIKQSESVFDLVELEGLWWIPAQGENALKVPGVLQYKVGEERELKLWGDLGAFGDSERSDFDVINGECSGNKFVTLFGCGVSSHTGFNRLGVPGIPVARIRFLEMWVGLQPYTRKEDVYFQEYTFGINNLEQWRNANSFTFQLSGDRFERVDISYVRPAPIPIYEDDNTIIQMVYSVGSLSSCVGQKSLIVEHTARIQVKAKSGKLPFYGLLNSIQYYLDVVFQFFTLLIGGFTFTDNCEGVSYDTGSPEVKGEYYQARSLSKEQTASVTDWEMFLPHKSINEKLVEMFKGFITNWEKLEPYVPLFTAFQNHIFSYTFHTLPELLYAFEGLERALYSNDKISLKGRLDAVYSNIDIPKIFPYLEKPNWDSLTSHLKGKVRDAHAHGRIDFYQSINTDSELDYNCCRWMSLLITAMVYHTCGLSPEEIHTSFTSNGRGGYDWIKAVFAKTLFSQASAKQD